MKLEKHFSQIYDFLQQEQFIWESEILKRDLELVPEKYLSFLNELRSKYRIEDLFLFENSLGQKGDWSSEFKNFLTGIRKLTCIPSFSDEKKFPSVLERGLSQKKLHELQRLNAFWEKLNTPKTFIDIGGGKGHTSNVYVYERKAQAVCIDINSDFQRAGAQKIHKWIPRNKDKIQFLNKDFSKFQQSDFYDKPALLMGLHACGPLTDELMNFAQKDGIKQVMSFACCYHKMKKRDALSQIGKQKKIEFSFDALTLAAKGFKKSSQEEHNYRIKVKKYRYGLHFLQQNYFSERDVGNGEKKDYEGSFSSYVKKYDSRFSDFSEFELESFLANKHELFLNYFYLDFIRAIFARPLELYITLDRALFLEENNWRVELKEVFDPSLSPRNILIYGSRE